MEGTTLISVNAIAGRCGIIQAMRPQDFLQKFEDLAGNGLSKVLSMSILTRPLQLAWSWRKTSAAFILLTAFLLLNFIAFMHAHAMTHFAAEGTRTTSPESLTALQKAKVLFTGVNIPRPTNHQTPEAIGLAFETHGFTAADATELEAWYLPCSQTSTIVVMFHGYASCKTNLLPEARAFHDLDYGVFLVDFRGSGGSAGRETTLGAYEAADVTAALDNVRARWPDRRLVLYGQSMGSAAILHAASQADLGVDALVLECPFDRLLATVENRFQAMHVPAFPAAGLLVFWGGVQHGFNGFRLNPVEFATHVKAPTLLLHGENDPRVTKDQADSIFTALSGPKELVEFPDVAHESIVAAQEKKWKDSVARFLRTNRAR